MTFDAVPTAILPVALVIVLGRVMRARHWVDDAFWPSAERINYVLFFPALLVGSLVKANLSGLPLGATAATQVAAIAAISALAVLLRPHLALDGPAFTSLYQGIQRPNTYVGLAVAAALWGRQGLALIALCTAVVVPVVNLNCVLALLRWARPAEAARPGLLAVIKPVAGNPLILASLGGIALNLSGIALPQVALSSLDILAGASLCLGLLSVGAGLEMGGAGRFLRPVALAATGKLLLLPALVLGFGLLFGLSGPTLAASVLYAALPLAPASYVLARQMGGDGPLIAAILSAELVAAALSLPLWLWLAGGV
jgi:malonate transporter and related proteins